jgi:hypothetical protein
MTQIFDAKGAALPVTAVSTKVSLKDARTIQKETQEIGNANPLHPDKLNVSVMTNMFGKFLGFSAAERKGILTF